MTNGSSEARSEPTIEHPPLDQPAAGAEAPSVALTSEELEERIAPYGGCPMPAPPPIPVPYPNVG